MKGDSRNIQMPVLALTGSHIGRIDGDGEFTDETPAGALAALARGPHLVCHSVFTAAKLAQLAGVDLNGALRAAEAAHADILELFAFVRPAQNCRPTVAGLAEALGLDCPENEEDAALLLSEAAARLLQELGGTAKKDKRLAQMTLAMAKAGWAWGQSALDALNMPPDEIPPGRGFDIWRALKPTDERYGRNNPRSDGVSGDEAGEELSRLLGKGAETRSGQSEYAQAAAEAFAPKDEAGAPNVVLAEAGTGIGKTLGYIAPAGLWAQRNNGTVWLSTFTRNLQRQIDDELSKLYPDPQEKAEKAVIRKGRENYLCLLNFEDLVTAPRGRMSVLAGLMARWALFSRDGDMTGGDFPAWIAPLFIGSRAFSETGNTGTGALLGLSDRRGECIHSACPHFSKCFIERAVKKSRQAEIVIANHAFIMSRKAMELSLPKDAEKPQNSGRFVFDEGHHIFSAADSAFSSHLSGMEMSELRRWMRGRETGRRRGRGLRERIGDLCANDDDAQNALEQAIEASSALPGPGWHERIGGAGRGAGEQYLALVRAQVLARAKPSRWFSLEADVHPLIPNLGGKADKLGRALDGIRKPLVELAKYLRHSLDEDAGELDSAERARLEGAAIGIERRAGFILPGWQDMLLSMKSKSGADFIDWLSLERHQGREIDCGMHRHFVDPSKAFAETVLEEADGAILTSATLRDDPPDTPGDWAAAEMRTGASHLVVPASRVLIGSPFDYAEQSRIFVINDVSKNEADIVASAMRELFVAAGGGALGIFTAIHRLRAVREKLAAPLLQAGLSLYAQHVDPLDAATLVDIFRAEENSCLLGTDALRDGIDVPGRSLRLVVFDRVPWPRGTIMERARREAFGGNAYVDMTSRLKLKQAFGRLIRRRDDKGVFVMLDRQLPTRLTSAFPPDAPLKRCGLAEAITEIRSFLGS